MENLDQNFFAYMRDEIGKLVEDPNVYFSWDIFPFPGCKKPKDGEEFCVYQIEDLYIKQTTPNHIRFKREILARQPYVIYEYSEANLGIDNITSTFKPWLPNLESEEFECEKDIDILFYGFISDRRRNIFEKYGDRITIADTTITHTPMSKLQELVRRSKYVLSYGTYSNVHNDLIRVTPVLNWGGKVLFERSQEEWYNEFLLDNFPDRVEII